MMEVKGWWLGGNAGRESWSRWNNLHTVRSMEATAPQGKNYHLKQVVKSSELGAKQRDQMSKLTSWFGFSLRSFNFNEFLWQWLSAAKYWHTFPTRVARVPREGVGCWPQTPKSSTQMHVFSHAAFSAFHSGELIRPFKGKPIWCGCLLTMEYS